MENTPRVIPLEGFPRRAHFEYFAAMANPYVGVTVKVDVGALLHACRAAGTPFSLSVIYCMGRAANAVPQLRQRISRGEILEYPRCDTSHTVLRPDETYGYCRLNCMQPFAEFLPEARARHAAAQRGENLEADADETDLLFLSALPWLHYTALTQPVPHPADSNPRITWGKYQEEGRRAPLPVTLLANHALVDGIHMAHFFTHPEAEMAGLAAALQET